MSNRGGIPWTARAAAVVKPRRPRLQDGPAHAPRRLRLKGSTREVLTHKPQPPSSALRPPSSGSLLFSRPLPAYHGAMPIDIEEVYRRGGKALIDLLEYCVRSVQMDPLFVFLVWEYRNRPTTPGALALYDLFCAPQAPARISAREFLPPSNLKLHFTILPLRVNLAEVTAAGTTGLDPPPPLRLPAKYLFDAVAQSIERSSASLKNIRSCYDPGRTPLENLPGGRMTPGQRRFVEKIWEPLVRPQLVSAGFWRVATIA
jgi:hypothetical protein